MKLNREMDKIIVELNDGSNVEVVKRCAHCTSMSCKKSNNYRFLCSKHGTKNLNDFCADFIISDVLVESLKTSKKHSISDIIKLSQDDAWVMVNNGILVSKRC